MPETTQTITVDITLHYADAELTPALIREALAMRFPGLFPGEIEVAQIMMIDVEKVEFPLAQPVYPVRLVA